MIQLSQKINMILFQINYTTSQLRFMYSTHYHKTLHIQHSRMQYSLQRFLIKRWLTPSSWPSENQNYAFVTSCFLHVEFCLFRICTQLKYLLFRLFSDSFSLVNEIVTKFIYFYAGTAIYMISSLNDVGLECSERQRAFMRYCSH